MKHTILRSKDFPLTILMLSFLLFFFFLRLKGIWFGFPIPTHPDEPTLVEKALRMLDTGDLNPHFFNYPSLNIYMQAIFFGLFRIFNNLFLGIKTSEINIINYYVVARFLVVLISTLTIIVTYYNGKFLFNAKAGFFATLFIGFSLLHTENSFTASVDSSVAFWALLATLMATLIFNNGKKLIFYFFGGIFVGFAISSKYTAFVSFMPIIIAHFYVTKKTGNIIDGPIVIALCTTLAAFIATTPYALIDYNTFLDNLKYEAIHYKTGHPGAQSETSTSFHLYAYHLFYYEYGVLPSIIALIGFAFLLKKDFWKALIIASTPILLFIFVGQYKTFFIRNIVATIPFMALLSGYGVFLIEQVINKTTKGLKINKSSQAILSITLTTAIIFIIIHNQSMRTIKYVQQITLPDTRWVSIDWIKNNIPKESRIGRESFTPPIEQFSKDFFVTQLGFCGLVCNPSFKIDDFDYIITSSTDYEGFFNSPEHHHEQIKTYKNLFENYERVYIINPDNTSLIGPTISIFMVRKNH